MFDVFVRTEGEAEATRGVDGVEGVLPGVGVEIAPPDERCLGV